MSTFSVDTAQVSAAGANVRRSVDIIRSEVATLMAQLNSLQGSWSGAAAVQFAEVARQWHATQGQVEANLESIKAALDRTASAYTEAELNIRSMFRN